MVRSKLFVVAAVMLLVPAAARAQAVNRDAVAKQIEASERAINAAVQKGDAAAFMANIADGAVSVDGSGAMPAAEFAKMLPKIKIASFTIDQVKVTFLSDTAAVISYQWAGKGTMDGQAFPSPVFASTAWANRGGKWVAVYHQETPAMAPPPPPPAPKKK